MRYLSVCSGIEAASVAWHHLGWTPVAFSEIEPFPAAVLAHRFPNVPNYGDMTRHAEWPLGPGSIDLLVGGTPCQAFSVAGLRGGLSDPRGGLMLTYLEIAQRLRPRWIVWENVPGVLSSGGGRDFGSFLGALGELGYGWAYRVLDAQWVRTQRHPRAVPQRRRRVFVVGCLGDGKRAAQVLFERESVQRDSAKGRAAGEGSAADAEAGVEAGCWQHVAETLIATDHKGPGHNRDHNFIPQPVHYDLFQITAPVNRQNRKPGDPCHTLARDNAAHAAVVGTDLYNGAITGDVAATMGTPGSSVNASGPTVMAFAQNQLGEVRTSDVSGTINTNSNASGRNTPMAAVAFPIDTQNMTEGHASGGLGFGQHGDPSFTVTKGHSHAVAHALRGEGFDASEDGTGRGTPLVPQAMTVRRLTPTECSRLQGFPDDWTLIPWRGKPADQCPDGPRYKALGNSMAVNCMAWIGERIAAVEDTHA